MNLVTAGGSQANRDDGMLMSSGDPTRYSVSAASAVGSGTVPLMVVLEDQSVMSQPMLVSQSLKLHVVQVVAGLNIVLVVAVRQVEAVFFSVQDSSGLSGSLGSVGSSGSSGSPVPGPLPPSPPPPPSPV